MPPNSDHRRVESTLCAASGAPARMAATGSMTSNVLPFGRVIMISSGQVGSFTGRSTHPRNQGFPRLDVWLAGGILNGEET
jgi:hypothetical protein